jgi:hypothetical protein
VSVGINVLSKHAAIDIAEQPSAALSTCPTTQAQAAEIREVAAAAWHDIVTADDIPEAERKLDTWLIKPTDGLFARMNRRISIPISRQLVKFPITANMVTLFVLGVSFASGLFRTWWLLSVLQDPRFRWRPSLDGCDGSRASEAAIYQIRMLVETFATIFITCLFSAEWQWV